MAQSMAQTLGWRGFSPQFLFILALWVGAGAWLFAAPPAAQTMRSGLVLVFVISGWMVSLCLHEGAHALTAILGGDRSAQTRSYLSLDPMAFAHPLTTFGLPVLFLLMGGIGLPGGAVWIDRSALRSRWWDSAMCAAGPSANVALLILLCLPFVLGLDAKFGSGPFWGAVGFLAFLQAMATVFNLLPIPGFDGFSILKPHLPYEVQRQSLAVANFAGLALIVLIFTVPPVNQAIFNMSRALAELFGLPMQYMAYGYAMFRFRA